MSQLKARQINI